MNRRETLFVVWAIAATALAVTLVGIIVWMLRPPTLVLGNENEAPPGSVTLWFCDAGQSRCVRVAGTDVEDAYLARDPSTVFVVHNSPTEWKAFVPVSPGPACFIKWVEARQRFEDPCFGARFARDGSYQEGPAPRNLDEYPIRAEEGVLKIELRVIPGASHR